MNGYQVLYLNTKAFMCSKRTHEKNEFLYIIFKVWWMYLKKQYMYNEK